MKKAIKEFLINKLKSIIAASGNKMLLIDRSLLDQAAVSIGIEIATLQKPFFEVIEELKDKKILVAGYMGISCDQYHLWITDYGIRCLTENMEFIYDPEGFIKRLKNKVPDIDPIAMLYFIECVTAFNQGLILSSTVCLGACSEKIILNLIDCYVNSTYGDRLKDKIINKKTINEKFNEFYGSVIDSKDAYKTKFSEIEDYLEKVLIVFKNIKENRNDAGHPTGKSFDKDELESFIRLFIKYAETIDKLSKFYKKNKIKRKS
ncbi:MAG: hypothetical protein ACYDIA_02270 [Candidatus Humimicrobiaceae bacterium]